MLAVWPLKSLNHDRSEGKLEIMKKRILTTSQANLRFLTIKIKILLKFEDKCQKFFKISCLTDCQTLVSLEPLT